MSSEALTNSSSRKATPSPLSKAILESQEALVEALSGFMSPNHYGWRAEYAFLIWSFVTVALATFATFIVARSSYRARV
jgi:hypothetical protein